MGGRVSDFFLRRIKQKLFFFCFFFGGGRGWGWRRRGLELVNFFTKYPNLNKKIVLGLGGVGVGGAGLSEFSYCEFKCNRKKHFFFVLFCFGGGGGWGWVGVGQMGDGLE